MSQLLLVEDERSLRRVFSIFLQRSGHSVVEADNGIEGLKAYQAQIFDIVISDLMMPEMGGIELIRKVRELSPLVPIIAMSGGNRDSGDCCLDISEKIGSSLTLQKPFQLKTLGEAVAQLLGPSAPETSTGLT